MKHYYPKRLKQQQGIVVVVALFFVALIATMSYYMMARLERDTRRTQLLLRNVKAELYAQGSIAWAVEQLRLNLKNHKPNTVVDDIPIYSPENEMNGNKISSVIYDAQARFNLNNLLNQEAQKYFSHLLHLVDGKLSEQKAKEIILAIVDWITPAQQQNKFSQYYLSLSPAYRAAHRQMVSASELQLIKGMTPKLYTVLQPYVIALPINDAKINVQTASTYVLAALSPTMTLATGQALKQSLAKLKITSTDAFLNLDLIKNHASSINKNSIDVISQYFIVETTVKIESQNVVLYTLLERSGNESKAEIRIVWQSKSISG